MRTRVAQPTMAGFADRFSRDRRGIAATEFAVIVPLMLVLFFGVIELTNGIAAYRKVTIMAHTLSDLTSQSPSVHDSDLDGFFCLATGVMTPFVAGPCPPKGVVQSIAELWIDASGQAHVQWGRNSDGSMPQPPGTVVPIPVQLQVQNTYVIYSSVTYRYAPVIGYVMDKAGIILSDFAYTRPRQSQCVLHDPSDGKCPTS